MLKEIVNNEKFQAMGTSFAVTLPEGTYTLYQSADGNTYTPYADSISGPDTLVVSGVKSGMYFYFDGLNNSVNVLL